MKTRKKSMKTMSAVLFTLLFVNQSIAQSTAITGMVGLLNAKARVQYEALLGDQSSVGANLNYYFVNWTGPKLEAFYRMYLGRDGNEKGFFIKPPVIESQPFNFENEYIESLKESISSFMYYVKNKKSIDANNFEKSIITTKLLIGLK